MNFEKSTLYKCCTDVYVDVRFLVLVNKIILKNNLEYSSDQKADIIKSVNVTFHISLKNGTNLSIGWEELALEDMDRHRKLLEQDRLILIKKWEDHHKDII